jgi:uncharacterized repeat protein (TIGR01451 family)
MFEKLISLLPYNPSMVHQLAFYGRRMREESSIRRIGLFFIAMAFLVQFFAVLSPAQSTVADSTNDLVNGGFSSAAEAANDCRSNIENYGTILANYGISCAKVASAPTITIQSTEFNRQLFSMGRLPYGIAGETPVTIAGTTYYARYLWGWDTGPASTYQALNVTSPGGQTFLLLYPCGNLTSVGFPVAIPPCKYNSDILSNSPQCVKPCPYNASISATSPQCFAPCPVPGKGTIPQTSPLCFEACPYNSKIPASSSSCFQPCPYNSKISSTSPQCFKPCPYNASISATSPQCFQPCPYNSAIPNVNSECKPCEASLSSQDALACVEIHKTAANTTQGLSDANNTTAQPNDIILYTLYAQNTGKATVPDYTFQEDLSDVLDYSTVDNLYGGTINSNDIVSWPAVNISPGATVTQTLSVKVDSPIPATPTSSSDPEHFNLVMTNVYGNTININVPSPPTKTIETTVAALPNTGPGESIFIAASIMIVAGYFFARSRLLAREAVIVVNDNINGRL